MIYMDICQNKKIPMNILITALPQHKTLAPCSLAQNTPALLNSRHVS